MLDKAIAEFLESKKQDFLKKKNKGNVSDEDKQSFILESENKYSLENWLIDASKRAKQLSLTSHPAKFVHPNAKTSSVIAHAKQENDGLLRSGNVDVQLDIFGNAAALDVEKFLRVRLQDGKTVLQHLEENTGVIQEQFTIEGIDYKKVRDDFMRVKSSDFNQTSEKIKQVYFPVGNAYHLLSILNSSGIIYKLKSEVNGLRFSEGNKQLREALKKANPQPMQGTISDLYGLVALGYGGTKPQNISTLNNQNGGVSLLLPSLPPNLSKRKVQPPKKDFFDNCLWDGLFQNDFEAFHEVLAWRKNNKIIRDKRDDIVLNAIAKVKRLIESIRDIHVGWSDSETYNGLLRWQKIWLDEQYADIRHDKSLNDDYLTKAQSYFSNWFINHYKSVIKDSKLLGDDDIQHVKKVLNDEQVLLK